jgi:cellulose biosynthesis protein BcsQ
MPKIITLFNHKGGVGKTTVAHNLGVSLTKQNKNVLLIDADPQMNLTSSVLGLADSVEYAEKNASQWQKARDRYTKINDYLEWYTTKNIRKDNLEINLFHYKPKQDVLFETVQRGKLSLLCGDIRLFEIESRLYSIATSKVNRNDGTVYSIEEGIREIGRDYDFIIIDTSPSANSILNGVMVLMADYFISPVFPNFFSLQAIDNLFEVFKNWIDLLGDFRSTANNKGLSFEPKFLGIVINMAKRFEGESGSKTTIYAEKWRDKLNSSIEKFYIRVLDNNRTITKSDFVKIFNDGDKKSEPFIIEELCDFTGQIRNVSEKSGIPVVDLNNDIVRETAKKVGITPFTISKTKTDSKVTHYHKAFSGVTESYTYIAKCISKNLAN